MTEESDERRLVVETPAVTLAVVLVLAMLGSAHAQQAKLVLQPAAITLHGQASQQQLLATLLDGVGESDATFETEFTSSNPVIATVGSSGLVRPVANGVVQIRAAYRGRTGTAQVTVVGLEENQRVSFANDVQPVLSRAGCNSGSCHGKQAGRNGFKLSLFGFDPEFDYRALISESRGRRVFPAAPNKSLLLAKAANRIPHGGGRRLVESSQQYKQLARWIEQGLLASRPDQPTLVGVSMTPSARAMTLNARQQVIVTASYSDGSTRDVTHLSLYTSNAEAMATVSESGRVATSDLGGEAAIMANYMGFVTTCRVTVPMNPSPVAGAQLAAWKTDHFIDRLVARKWSKLNLAPSPMCDDATYLRRAFLDTIGRLPTVDEVRTFLKDKSPDRRQALIQRLLDRDEYADFWALKWADLFRLNPEQIGSKNALLFDRWLRESFRANKPFDEFVRQLITAQGSSFRDPAVNFYKGFPKPNDLTIAVSQVFLGIRLECAQCHHHPYEKWGQDDFYGLAAFFPRLQRKAGANGEELLFASARGEVTHPNSKVVMLPRVLGGETFEASPDTDRRIHLADWLVQRDNPYVARTLVNRMWAHFMGRGIVDPIDDMRDTNPATNQELLDGLAQDFLDHKFDLKHLIRTITSSNAYRLSSVPNQWNVRDTDHFSRAYRKRLPAEVLLDAVCDVTETQASFEGVPPGTRAVQLWNNRLPSGFLDVFGRPERKSVCECERTMETSLAQVLHLMNAPSVNDRIQSPTGRAARLASSKRSEDEIIVELYLAALNRLPADQERNVALAAFRTSSDRRRATEDILWALLNTAEFVLNH